MTAVSKLSGGQSYVAGEHSFLAGLRPQEAVAAPMSDVIDLLRVRYGDRVDLAVSPDAIDPEVLPASLPDAIRSPRAAEPDTAWMRRTNMVGINVRTVGDYAGVVRYALTLPAASDSIHLLPIWEPGVVDSLYGMASWNLNREFFSDDWQAVHPQLDTVAKQLRAMSNLLHVMGKAVGMDVIPHTDRFSEMALGMPDLFEWMRLDGGRIVDHADALHVDVERLVHAWAVEQGSAAGEGRVPGDPATLFEMAEVDRLQLLFGEPGDVPGRTRRRVALVKQLKQAGYEPVPATMGVPFRGIDVDPGTGVMDEHGLSWLEYVMTRPQFMSRVFSPLARFKLYGRINDNADWEIDFSAPRRHVWEYVCDHYGDAQRVGAFDFMRGDMSHVQMRPDGVPDRLDEHYDILGAVKSHIRRGVPWFGYFAESFLPARDVFGYGEELDHLDASLVDATLGDLQSTVVGSAEFLRRFRRYLDDLATRRCAPSFTVGTGDKDDPRFDEFYRAGTEARWFTALFLPDMPSYVGNGFEIRDVHSEPVENERYTKLFVFREHGPSNVYPSKARVGDHYVWGENDPLFATITALRLYAEEVIPMIAQTRTRWLVPPDATARRGTAVWTQSGPSPSHVFAVNYDLESGSGYFGIPALSTGVVLESDFSTRGEVAATDRRLMSNGFFHRIANLAPGEGRAYRVVDGV